MSSQKAFYSTVKTLLLDHDEAKSEGLLLSHGSVSDFGVTVSSRKAIYSAIETPPTQP